MPRHNCSDLERFCKNLDLDHVIDHYKPEVGPFYWLRKSQYGMLNARNIAYKGSKFVGLSALDRYPMFTINGQLYSAMRWLYFQMYDDRHLFSYNKYEFFVTKGLGRNRVGIKYEPEKVLNNRKLYKGTWKRIVMWGRNNRAILPEDFWGQLLDPDPDYARDMFMWAYEMASQEASWNSRPFYLCAHQQAIGLRFYNMDWTKTTTDMGVRIQAMSKDVRPWNMMFWWDEKYDERPPDNRPYLSPLCEARRNKQPNGDGPYNRIDLVFPEYVGPDRLKLVRHYLTGGTDDDRPEPDPYLRPTDDWLDWEQRVGADWRTNH